MFQSAINNLLVAKRLVIAKTSSGALKLKVNTNTQLAGVSEEEQAVGSFTFSRHLVLNTIFPVHWRWFDRMRNMPDAFCRRPSRTLLFLCRRVLLNSLCKYLASGLGKRFFYTEDWTYLDFHPNRGLETKGNLDPRAARRLGPLSNPTPQGVEVLGAEEAHQECQGVYLAFLRSSILA